MSSPSRLRRGDRAGAGAERGRQQGQPHASIGRGRGGVMLSGHTDVVPIDGGPGPAALCPDRESGAGSWRRGTADMKGFVACAPAAMLRGRPAAAIAAASGAELATRELAAGVHSFDRPAGGGTAAGVLHRGRADGDAGRHRAQRARRAQRPPAGASRRIRRWPRPGSTRCIWRPI